MLLEVVQATDGLAKVLHDLVDEALSELAVGRQSAQRRVRARAREREIFVAYKRQRSTAHSTKALAP